MIVRDATHIDAEQGLDQLHHGAAIPQGKGQTHLGGVLADNDRAQMPFLGQSQGATRQVAPTSGLGLQAARALRGKALGPANDRTRMHPHYTVRFRPWAIPTLRAIAWPGGAFRLGLHGAIFGHRFFPCLNYTIIWVFVSGLISSGNKDKYC